MTHNEKHRNFIKKKMNDRDDIEDIMQMTYLEAIRCKERFNGYSKPETWLFGIALNLTRSYHKKQYAQPQMDEISEELLSELEQERVSDPSLITEHEMMLSKTLQAMESLPDDVQTMFDMVVGSNRNYQETAEKLGIPIGTIRSRLFRARSAIKAKLGLD
ncbi:MAG: RNA polymerase sigma factor [Reinekea sp.]